MRYSKLPRLQEKSEAGFLGNKNTYFMRVEIKGVGIQTETLKDVKTLEDLHAKEIFSHLSEES